MQDGKGNAVITTKGKAEGLIPALRLAASDNGAALIIVLMIIAALTAMVVEFAYGVYTATSGLYTWRDSQRLSLAARSGVSLAVKTISEIQALSAYTYPQKVEMPVENILEDFNGNVIVNIEDEASRFNINSVINRNGTLNESAYRSLKRLLAVLNLDQTIAERIADWIDKDSEPRLGDSEKRAKNGYMDTVDELLLINGIDRKIYEALLPYVTVYGYNNPATININTASIPVIMCIDDSITRDVAEKIVRAREFKPFESTADPNFTGAAGSLKAFFMGRIGVKSSFFRITTTAKENGISRIIEIVAEINNGQAMVRYWKEI